MEQIYEAQWDITDAMTDCFDRLKLSQVLALVQQAAGAHSNALGTGREALARQGLFWAVLRHRVQLQRLPAAAERITLQTWPMPTTRSAFPRAAAAYDSQGRLLFRSVSLWVLMEQQRRSLVLPGKSGVQVPGLLRGNELESPASLLPREAARQELRSVRFTELDVNGHMNNCRYLDWVEDLLSSEFHKAHPAREFSVCYLSEATRDQQLRLCWELSEQGLLSVEATRQEAAASTGHSRVFAACVQY